MTNTSEKYERTQQGNLLEYGGRCSLTNEDEDDEDDEDDIVSPLVSAEFWSQTYRLLNQWPSWMISLTVIAVWNLCQLQR